MATGGNDRMLKKYEEFECLSKQSDHQMELKGLTYADEYSYIEIDLELCEQHAGDDCASVEETEAFFNGRWPFSFHVGFKN